MRTFKDVLAGGVCLLLFIGCVVVAVVGHGEERKTGILCALFLGGCGVVIAGERLGRRGRGVAIRERTVLHDGVHSPAFVIAGARSGILFAFVGAVAFLVAGTAGVLDPRMLAEPGEDPRTALAFCGGAALLGLAGVTAIAASGFGRRLGLAFLPEGLLHGTLWRVTFVPWRAVRSVGRYRRELPGGNVQRFLGIAVAGGEDPDIPPEARKRMAGARKRSAWDLTLPEVHLSAPLEAVERAVRYYVETPAARAAIGTADGLARLREAVASDPPAAPVADL